MDLIWMSALIFVATFGLAVSAYYFLVEAPAVRKRLQERLHVVRFQTADPHGWSPRPEEKPAGLARSTDPSPTAGGSPSKRPDLIDTAPAGDGFVSRIPSLLPFQRFMQQAATRIPAARLFLIAAGLALAGLALGIAAGARWSIAAGVAAGAGAIPFLVLAHRRQRRLKRFEEGLPDAIDLLARVIRAGHSLTTGLDLTIADVPEPIAGEFRIVYDQHRLGLSLREALNNLAVRVPLPDVAVFVTALQIQRETGGNLIEVLDNLSGLIRERFRLYRQVRVITAEGRISLGILMALPPFLAVFLFIFDRPYVMRLMTEPLGRQMVMVAVLMQAAGYLVIRRIISFKV